MNPVNLRCGSTDLVGSIDVKASRRRTRLTALKLGLQDEQVPKQLQTKVLEYYSRYLSDGADYSAEQRGRRHSNPNPSPNPSPNLNTSPNPSPNPNPNPKPSQP